MKAKVGTQSKRYANFLEKIYIVVTLYEVLSIKRKIEDHETGEVIDVKRGRLTFEVGDKRIKSKPER